MDVIQPNKLMKKTLLNTTSGNCTLNIIAINPDSLTKQESKMQITEAMLRNEIRIAAIQETHIPNGQNYLINGYRLITSAAIRDTEQPLTGAPVGA